MTRVSQSPRPGRSLLTLLALLYTAQGIPFGLASEYLPVVMREGGMTRTRIAMLAWLMFPWQLKVLWASVADRPHVQARSREVLFAIQLVLAALMAAYVPFDVRRGVRVWFALTALCAFVSATQDIFVDALAVRALPPHDRGAGNVAQVGVQLGILLGGAGLLSLAPWIGRGAALGSMAALIALTGLGAFWLRADPDVAVDTTQPTTGLPAVRAIGHVVGRLFTRETRAVLLVLLTFKLAPHMAAALIKPMCVDAHWSEAQIGRLVVGVGIVAGLLGAAAGGRLTHAPGDRRGAAGRRGAACVHVVPLVIAAKLGVPIVLTSAAIGVEHFASGLGTTVLFGGLVTATQRTHAAMQYTVLTSVNVPR